MKFPATAAATKAPAQVSREVGGSVSCHGGYITGRNPELVPGKLIVQTWRGKDFPAAAPDSILILAVRDVEGGAELHMTHANVPDALAGHLDSGWHKSYWDPWKAYLQKR